MQHLIESRYARRVGVANCHLLNDLPTNQLDAVPSNKIMWGADCTHAEGIYGATEFTRRCLAEALSEKVDHGELSEVLAERIGRQILRNNALELFPQLKERLWKGKRELTAPTKK